MKLGKTTAILLVATAVFAPAFAKKEKKADTPPPAAAAAAPAQGSSGDSTAAAIVAGETITIGDIDKLASSQLLKLRQQEYDTRKNTLNQLINSKLISQEAAARKVTDDELLKIEVEAKAVPPTDQELQDYYDRMKGRMGGKPFDDVKADIKKALTMQKQVERRSQFEAELRAKSSVQVMLDPPRIPVSVAKDSPGLGPVDAPVLIVEWSDYQCPFCKRAHPTMEQVVNEYKDKVRFVYLDYPLAFHKQAWPASVAAHCAGDQGKFWEYHANLMVAQGDLSPDDLTKRATDVGLDTTAFTACLDSKKHDAKIQAAFNDGAAVGVTGTPAFFINGRMLVGAQPIETFRDVINDELNRKGVKVATAAGTK